LICSVYFTIWNASGRAPSAETSASGDRLMLFPPDFLTRLEYLSLVSKRVFRGQLLAQRRSQQMGSGIEFSEHREYNRGDDLRYLDWNIYARHGDLLLRRFQEEQDLQVHLLLDCSRSMGFGQPAKFDLARQLAAALAYIALADLDRTSVAAYADGLLTELPVSRGRARIISIMKSLENLQPSGQDTNLEKAMQELLHRSPRTGLAIVISDLFDERGFQRGLDLLRYRQFDVHVIQLHDPREAQPDIRGDTELFDMETESVRNVTVSERTLDMYQQLFQKHQSAVRDYCRHNSIGCTQSPSVVGFDELILRMMREVGSDR
jgi:uncharacterized protein (DUF58 family)